MDAFASAMARNVLGTIRTQTAALPKDGSDFSRSVAVSAIVGVLCRFFPTSSRT
jgi:hypothetical protein